MSHPTYDRAEEPTAVIPKADQPPHRPLIPRLIRTLAIPVILVWIGIVVVLLIVGGAAAFFLLKKPPPAEGEEGEDADIADTGEAGEIPDAGDAAVAEGGEE